MQRKVMQKATAYLRRARRRRGWIKAVSVLGCAVVFCTTYALILPAITLTQNAADEMAGIETELDGDTVNASRQMYGDAAMVNADAAPGDGKPVALADVDADGNVTFTAYDNEVEAEAHTRFTVTLPQGTTIGGTANISGYTLKIQKYTEGTDEFYYADHKRLIDGHMNWHTGVADSTNDVQFWRVYFVDENNAEVEVKLPQGENAAIVVEYLDPTDALQGALGTRRTCVMDMGDVSIGVPEDIFVNTEEYSLATSYETQDIGKEDNYYTKLTYYIDADEDGGSAWGNLVALCSMKLTAGYMRSVTITEIADGSAPFDAEEESGIDEPGNDSGSGNKIVRTFDSVTYTLQHVSASRSTTGQLTQYVAVLEAELPMDITQARFDAADLNSVFSGDEPWQIEYKDEAGDNLYIENSTGIFKCNQNGGITNEKVTVNSIANASNSDNPYCTLVKSQRLVAYRAVIGTNDNPAVPSEKTVTVKINVSAAANGDKIEPSFKMYVKGNKDNFTSEQDDSGQYTVSAPSKDNEIATAGTNNVVTVSAAARYNIVIKRNNDASYSSYFDFESGQGTTQEDENGTYGRILGYGITLQLFNETNKLVEYKDKDGNSVKDGDGNLMVPDGSLIAEKGLRGIELPAGNITFDLTLEGNAGKDNNSKDDYSAILWDYATPTGSGANTGIWGRNMLWDNATVITYPKGASIYSSGGDRKNSAYDSGTWTLSATGDGVEDGKTTGQITNTGNNVSYKFTVNGFDFDFDNFTFPYESAGTSGNADWLAPNYIGGFAGGYIQVLQKYPDEPTETASPEISAKVGNIEASSQSGTKMTNEAKEVSDKIGGIKDNEVRMNVAVYTPGTISKHNSFGARTNSGGAIQHGSIAQNFLGTSYWSGPAYDADAFAGSQIYLWGGTQLARNSDAVVSAYNLLQKFDGTVLSIDDSVVNPVRYTEVNGDNRWPAANEAGQKWDDLDWTGKEYTTLITEEAGEWMVLYAADPLYPEGWDSNDPEQMERMNDATEEDLVYFSSLEELEDKGYTCTAVLLEVRNANIPAGCYPGVRIAVKVSDKLEDIGDTIATVNASRMWVKPHDATYNIFGDASGGKADTSISWENGYLNSFTKEKAKAALEDDKVNKVTADKNESGEDLYTDWWSPGTDDTKVKEKVNKVNKKLKEIYGDAHQYTARYLIPGFNNYAYTKTEYTNGVKVEGTHQGYQQGMSLLVIGYESSINLQVKNTRTDKSSADQSGNVSFETQNGDWNPLYTITGISTTPSDPEGTGGGSGTTKLTITADVQNAAGKDQIAMGAAAFRVKSSEDWIAVSEDENNLTSVTFTGKDGLSHTYQIWAKRIGNYQVVFQLTGVPIGEDLPDIQFEGQLGADIEHTGNYTAQVSIQGDGDNRAISTGNRNMASVSITTIALKGTSLTKRVDNRLIEQNGEFTYSVSYTNNADEAMKQDLYLYDMMPYNGDIRNTSYTATTPESPTTPTDDLTVASVGANVTSGADGTTAYYYYSTITQSVLKSFVEFGNGQEKPGGGTADPRNDGVDIDQMLRNALLGDDARGVYYIVKIADFNAAKENGDFSTLTPVDIYTYDKDNNKIVTGVNTEIVAYDTSEPLGTVSIKENMQDTYAFWNVRTKTIAQSGENVQTDLAGFDGELTLYKMFRWLGSIKPGPDSELDSGDNVGSTGVQNQLKYASCIYTVVEKLDAGATLTTTTKLKTNANEASDIYGNIAHSWKKGDGRTGANLTSNLVTTRVVGREISGLVWEDKNKDGIQNLASSGTTGPSPEPTISGVKCTLFKLEGDKYVAVEGDEGPSGRLIAAEYMNDKGETAAKKFAKDEPVKLTTGADGKYRFYNLAAGNYVVAFSGDALKKFQVNDNPGVTQYQVNGGNDSQTNDGVVNAKEKFPGIDEGTYDYCIQYSMDQDGKANSIYLHTLDEMKADGSMLTNGVEVISHQDLGLFVERYSLPETGGTGRIPYTAGGALMVGVSVLLLCINQKRRKGM